MEDRQSVHFFFSFFQGVTPHVEPQLSYLSQPPLTGGLFGRQGRGGVIQGAEGKVGARVGGERMLRTLKS